jgi:hypothetical protein
MKMMKQILTLFLVGIAMISCNNQVKSPSKIDKFPPIYPDYVGVTVPATIAPLNFSFPDETFDRVDVVVKGKKGNEIHVNGDAVSFSSSEWKSLLESNKGDSVLVTVCLKQNGNWKQYKSFPIYISKYPIDYGLVYRLVAPGYEVYSKMGIYQRELASYKQTALYENTLVTGSCVNCHSFNKTNPDHSSLHLRGNNGATYMNINGKAEFLNTKTDKTIGSFVYPYWHPTGKYVAYSVNKTRQVFHVAKDKRIEVVDLESDIIVYKPETKQVLTSDLLKTASFETFPAFSADGRTLYFCSAEKKEMTKEYEDVKYSLCSISFNPENGTFGDHIDTLVSAKKINRSISFPRPSYDGKYIMFTLSNYGNFSIWHKEADLWLLNLADGSIRDLKEVNSDDTESYHNWSSNSQWFVFSSRRDGGLYTRLYIASIDNKGKVCKPFLLPQEDPFRYYDESVYSYNVPDFVSSPVKWDVKEMEKGITSKERTQVKIKK